MGDIPMSLPQPPTTLIPTMSGKEVVRKLDALYPDIKSSLTTENPFQLLIAVVLSAQTTDASVDRVIPALFARYPTSSAMAKAPVRTLEKLVKQTGFFHVKARRIKEISKIIERDYSGRVPETMDDLLKLPGVGRKTANIVLEAGFNRNEGIAVDTHVFRVSRRVGLTDRNTPEKVEQDLMKITPKKKWSRLATVLFLHGKAICHARNPECEKCVLRDRCLYFATTRGNKL